MQCRPDGECGADHQHGVAVRRRPLERLRGDDAVSATAVVHDHLMAPASRHFIGDESSHKAGAASRGIGDDEAHRPAGVFLLGRRVAANAQEHDGCE
jgi:hypothetical protein